MKNLRKAAEMALEVMSKEPESFTRWVEDMRQAREALREALTPEVTGKVFVLDRGCWERGCVAYDERDGDGVNISARTC